MVENLLDRYLINSAMANTLKKDADGGVTLYLQHRSPGAARSSNWLPAPNGPMGAVLRMYLPRAEALNGELEGAAIGRDTAASRAMTAKGTVTNVRPVAGRKASTQNHERSVQSLQVRRRRCLGTAPERRRRSTAAARL
jgi:hypothetical protein